MVRASLNLSARVISARVAEGSIYYCELFTYHCKYMDYGGVLNHLI